MDYENNFLNLEQYGNDAPLTPPWHPNANTNNGSSSSSSSTQQQPAADNENAPLSQLAGPPAPPPDDDRPSGPACPGSCGGPQPPLSLQDGPLKVSTELLDWLTLKATH